MLETICDVLKVAYNRNWITSRDGNCSIRWHDRDHFWITPSGQRKQTLQPELFKKLDLHGNKLYYTAVSDSLQPSGELPLHLMLQREICGEVRVVLHLHPTYTLAAIERGIKLENLVLEFPELGRYTRVAKSVGLVKPISAELGEACVENLELVNGKLLHDIVAIRRHGVVAVDSSPWRALEHIERLEHICKIAVLGGVSC